MASSQRVRKTPISDKNGLGGDGIFITKHKLTMDNLERAFPVKDDTKKSNMRNDDNVDVVSEGSVQSENSINSVIRKYLEQPNPAEIEELKKQDSSES